MFIKKDLRKIPTILQEAIDCEAYDASVADDNENEISLANRDPKKKRTKREEPLRILKLGRRKQEFEGSVKILCQPPYIPKLQHLEVLNLYDCDIHDLEGFGPMFEKAAPKLETLNLGRNPLSNGIPDDFCKAKSIKHLWLDDCNLKGALPKALLHLPNLESLRLPNNQITSLDIGGIDTNALQEGEEFEFDGGAETSKVIPLLNLKILCLDRNRLGGCFGLNDDPSAKKNLLTQGVEAMEEGETSSTESRPTFLPSNLAEWAPNLEECFLRHNQLTELRVNVWPKTLRILQISSNKLKSLDELVPGTTGGSSLTHLYANGNLLQSLPQGILTSHPKLERLVVSHNPPLTHMPQEVWERVQDEQDDKTIQILWQPNPNLKEPGSEPAAALLETAATAMQVC